MATSLIVCASGHAESLQPLDIYKRCYIRLARMVPVETDALFVAVKNGTKNPTDACTELFDRAKFNSNGVLAKRTDVEAKSILRTLHDLHQSWFQSKIHTNIAAGDLIRDAEEAPLYFTRAAFSPGVKFGSVVTHNTGLAGVRDQIGYPDEENRFLVQRLLNYNTLFPYAGETDLIVAYTNITHDGTKFVSNGVQAIRRPSNMLTEIGDLVGIKPAVSFKFPSLRPVSSTSVDVTESLKKMITNFDANAHFGGGIIGSQAFFMNNANLGGNVLAFEYAKINRRLTARVFEDLLCHQLPTLSDADVAGEVLPSSPHTFQKNSSCMRCHSSIDGMGFGYRNMVLFATGPNPRIPTQVVGLNFHGVASLIPSATATYFPVQIPEGRLHYRELVTKTRRDMKFFSLQELGTQLAAGQDLYTCAAKRYYKFFTGVDVDLSERATQELDKYHQDQVLALGTAFKTHQSVRTLLRSIFNSPAFKSSHYLTEKPK